MWFTFVGFGLAGIGFAIAWPRLWTWLEARSVFGRLAQANGLTAPQSRWLWQLARRVSSDEPALVFVRPSLFAEGGAAGGSAMARDVASRLFD